MVKKCSFYGGYPPLVFRGHFYLPGARSAFGHILGFGPPSPAPKNGAGVQTADIGRGPNRPTGALPYMAGKGSTGVRRGKSVMSARRVTGHALASVAPFAGSTPRKRRNRAETAPNEQRKKNHRSKKILVPAPRVFPYRKRNAEKTHIVLYALYARVNVGVAAGLTCAAARAIMWLRRQGGPAGPAGDENAQERKEEHP